MPPRRLIKKQKENAHKGEAFDTMSHPCPQQDRQPEVAIIDAIVQQSRCSKIVVDEDPLIINIIRSREMTTTMHVRDTFKFVEEAYSISIETLLVLAAQVEDTLALVEIHNGDQ